MITKEFETRSTVLPDGRIEVSRKTIILEDGEVLGHPSYHRHVVEVGADVSNEDIMVKEIASKVHTKSRIAARKKQIKLDEIGEI